MLQTALLGPRDQALLSDLLSSEFAVVWEVRSEGQGVLVAKRVSPPTTPRGANPPAGECYPRSSLDTFQPDLQAGG